MLEQVIYSIPARLVSLFDDSFLFSLLQVGVFLAFVITAVRAWRASRSRFRELITAVVFGLLLEEGDIIIFGTYSYNRHWITIGYVPIAIGLTWAMIIASAMNLTDAFRVPSAESLPGWRSKSGIFKWLALASLAPVADALWAIILDLSLDAVAIRMSLWTWRIPLDQGWFGVPWGNFYSWLFVAAMFSFFTRLMRRREAEKGPAEGWWQLSVPFLAYGGLLASLVPFIALQLTVFAANRQNTAPVFFIALAMFTAITAYALWISRRLPRDKADRWLIFVRSAIHFTFLGAIFLTGIFMQLPILLWVALAMLAVELALTSMLRRAYNGMVIQRVTIRGDSRAE